QRIPKSTGGFFRVFVSFSRNWKREDERSSTKFQKANPLIRFRIDSFFWVQESNSLVSFRDLCFSLWENFGFFLTLSETMGRGKFKGKPTGQRRFSSAADILAGTSAARPKSFKQKEAEYEEDVEDESEEESEEESEDDADVKKKGTESVIEVDNPNRVRQKTIKARDLDRGAREAASS
ncbi:hypothetical protein CARUB_v10027026mg, partial [Capsella rubella]